MLSRLFAFALLLPFGAFAQSASLDSLLSGFANGCTHTKAYEQLERTLCKPTVERKTGLTKCGPGSLNLPETHTKALDKPSVSFGAPAKMYGGSSPYLYQDEGDFAAYTWNYKSPNVFFGPLVVDQMRLALGHSNGIRYGGVRIANAKTAAEAQKILADKGIALRFIKDEALGQTGARIVLDKEDNRVWMYCDLSN